MKLLKKIFSIFLTYKFFAFIESIYYYVKDYNRISDAFYSDEFKNICKKYLKCDINKDWLGRLYGIINPMIDINGKIDISSMIIEIDGNNTNNIEFIKNWIYRQMSLVGTLFKTQHLYNYISLDIRKVGPENYDNYLIIFDIASRQYMSKCFKKLSIQLLIYTIIIGIIIILI